MEYTKPQLTYEEQVDKLIERGLGVPDRSAATALLQSVGYYRLSAYVYPFRVPLPEDGRTASHTRSEKVLEGVTLDHVWKVWEFDRKLRLLVLDATEVIEAGLRTQIAYVLGRRGQVRACRRGVARPKAVQQDHRGQRRAPEGVRHVVRAIRRAPTPSI